MLRGTILAETSMLHLLIVDRFVCLRVVSMIVIRYLRIFGNHSYEIRVSNKAFAFQFC